MTDLVYRSYTREALDAQYTNLTSDAAKAASEAAKEHAARNLETLKPERGLAYGDGPAQVFDLYRAGDGQAPGLVYISGGQWQRGGPGTACTWAESCVVRGVAVVDGGFPQIPDARLPEIVDSVVALVRHVRAHAGALGIDPARIAVTGHSSGAHLAAAALVRLANEDDLDGIACAYLVSGHYDLRPAMLCYRGKYLRLSPAETVACSPLLTLVRPLPPAMIAIGGAETDEMLRQSTTFHETADSVGTAELRIVPDANHFSVGRDLATPGSPSWAFLGDRLALADSAAAAAAD